MNNDAWLLLGAIVGIGVPAVLVALFHLLTVSLYPNESLLVLRFGRLVRREDTPGLHIVPDGWAPWVKELRVSRRARATLIRDIEVHDAGGSELRLDAFVEFRVVEPVLASFAIDDLESALSNVVAHATLSVLGSQPWTEIVRDRGALGDRVREETREEVAAWGVQIDRILWRQIRPSSLATEQMLGEVAARLHRTKARVEEEGRQAVALLHARTAARIADKVGEARGQYSLFVGRAYAEIKKDPAVHGAFQELHDLTLLRPNQTVAFRGFEAAEIRPSEVALLAPDAMGPAREALG